MCSAPPINRCDQPCLNDFIAPASVLWLRFAEQQVNLLRHDRVDAEFETAAHTFQPSLKYLLVYGSREPGTAMLAPEHHEVSLPGRLESFQSPAHKASLRLRKSPLQANERLEWATGPTTLYNLPGALGLHMHSEAVSSLSVKSS
jgi:hypothetical protein